MRERFLEKASLEHWIRGQGSREDRSTCWWQQGKTPVLLAVADYLSDLGPQL